MTLSQNYSGNIGLAQVEPYPYGRSLTRQLELMHEENSRDQSQGKVERPGFATIDDLLEIAKKLVDGLGRLGERKDPLSIRRGVSHMEREKEGEMLKASSKTYFFDIKETREGKPYLVITESRLKGEGEKPERSSIMIFQENVEEFSSIVSRLAEKVNQGN
jgi:uncharacterized protein DUF3276